MATTTKTRKKGRATQSRRTKAKRSGDADRGVHLVMHGVEPINPDAIEPNPWQPRQFFDQTELQALAAEFKSGSQLQPILVRKKPGNDGYQLLCGERRWRAAKIAGVSVDASICECSDRDARLIALHENTHRQDLSAVEQARSYQMMLDAGDAAGPTELAEQLGLSQSTVSNRLRLLDLPGEWQRMVISREITERHARAVLPYVDRPGVLDEIKERLAADTAEKGCLTSVWDLEHTVIPTLFSLELDDEDESQARDATTPETPPSADGDDTSAVDEDSERDVDAEGDAPCEVELHTGDAARSGKEATGKDFASRLWAWKCMFLRHAIASHLRNRASEAELLKVALLMLWKNELWSADESMISSACTKAAGMRPKKDTLGVILVLDDIETPKAAGAVLANAFWREDTGPQLNIPSEDLLPIAVSLGVDLAEAWQAGDVPSPQGYWDLHTKERLLAIAKEVQVLTTLSLEAIRSLPRTKPDGLSFADLEKMRKSDLVATLMRAMAKPDSKEAGIPMPKEIAKAKQPKK